MKRFLFAVVLITVIIGVMFYFTPRSAFTEVFNYAAERNAVVNIYCRSANGECINLGAGYQVTCSADSFGSVIKNCNGIDGISVSFEGSMNDVAELTEHLKAESVSSQKLGDLYVACFNSPCLKRGVTLDGKRVNLQIAYSSGVITVGYPLILGSY